MLVGQMLTACERVLSFEKVEQEPVPWLYRWVAVWGAWLPERDCWHQLHSWVFRLGKILHSIWCRTLKKRQVRPRIRMFREFLLGVVISLEVDDSKDSWKKWLHGPTVFWVTCEVPVSMGELYAAKKGPTPGTVSRGWPVFFSGPVLHPQDRDPGALWGVATYEGIHELRFVSQEMVGSAWKTSHRTKHVCGHMQYT